MTELILLVGVPASGKSTFRDTFFPEAAIVNPDSFIGYTKENPWTSVGAMIAWKKSDELLIEYISQCEEKIVFDATFITPKRRKKYIKIAKQNNIKVSAIYLEIPLKVAKERNAKRDPYRTVPEKTIIEMYEKLVPPAKEEGFDEVFLYNFETKKLKLLK